jgi:TetR/AcrR family transcriptional regulator, transcriptional repressor for nem operon
MARNRQFDPDEALEKAMNVFWSKGYANTSIEDLVNATGVNRYGLYEEFESKRGLFLASLNYYQQTIVKMLFELIEAPQAALPEVISYFSRLAELSSAQAGYLGCLMINCACEVAPYDSEVAARVECFRNRMQQGFRHALNNAKAAGQLSVESDPEQIADFLTGVVQGLSVMARSGAQPKMMANMINISLGYLK